MDETELKFCIGVDMSAYDGKAQRHYAQLELFIRIVGSLPNKSGLFGITSCEHFSQSNLNHPLILIHWLVQINPILRQSK
jgi:hypothetical protein